MMPFRLPGQQAQQPAVVQQLTRRRAGVEPQLFEAAQVVIGWHGRNQCSPGVARRRARVASCWSQLRR